jgi:hypothetical protein
VTRRFFTRHVPVGVGELVIAALEGASLQARAQADVTVVDRIGTVLANLLRAAETAATPA